MNHSALHDLVDVPRARLEVQYMAWLNLDDREVQAGLASHLCAIANHVGGFVVFGIANDMRPARPQPHRGRSLRSGQAVGNQQAVSALADAALISGRGYAHAIGQPDPEHRMPRDGVARVCKDELSDFDRCRGEVIQFGRLRW